MISVAEARRRILDPLAPTGIETVGLADALGRVLAAEARARVTQPPVAISAMDGYAVRADDVARTPATLRQVGEAPAGGAHEGVVGPGEAVRIFTGGPVPRGTDTSPAGTRRSPSPSGAGFAHIGGGRRSPTPPPPRPAGPPRVRAAWRRFLPS